MRRLRLHRRRLRPKRLQSPNLRPRRRLVRLKRRSLSRDLQENLRPDSLRRCPRVRPSALTICLFSVPFPLAATSTRPYRKEKREDSSLFRGIPRKINPHKVQGQERGTTPRRWRESEVHLLRRAVERRATRDLVVEMAGAARGAEREVEWAGLKQARAVAEVAEVKAEEKAVGPESATERALDTAQGQERARARARDHLPA
jgi:hypothetical protein